MVRELLRVPPQADRSEWCQSRAVANQCGRSPVGERDAADYLLALQRSRGLPDQQRRTELVGMDDARHVRRMSERRT